MKTIYTATITLEISGDINRMEPEEIPVDHCDVDDNTFYPLAFTSQEELERHASALLIRTIGNLMKQYNACKLIHMDLRHPGSDLRFICRAEMTYLDADKEQQYINLSVYEDRFKVKE